MEELDYDGYAELCEAVYFFHKIKERAHNCDPAAVNAVYRILVTCGLLEYGNEDSRESYWLTKQQEEEHRYILENAVSKNPGHYEELFAKAQNESQFFFDSVSELEYEIYSRCNFQVTLNTGMEVVKHMQFLNGSVLELGGNSGGLATAILRENENCRYTVVDTAVPCAVGNEFKEINGLEINFVTGDVFNLSLPEKAYGCIIIMNLLHDFDNEKCLEMLRGCLKYCGEDTKFIVIEDILTSKFEPREVLTHGLRLAVECRGGGQRTAAELEKLFLKIGCGIEKTTRLDAVHTMLVLSKPMKDWSSQ